jgi:hypothetical protein
MSVRLVLSLSALVCTALLTGCDRYTCEGACDQYYVDCERPSLLADGTTPELARRNCVSDCSTALYTTTIGTGGIDERNYRVLEGQSDAEEFINCVAEQDYSEAAFNATCADLLDSCSWYRW